MSCCLQIRCTYSSIKTVRIKGDTCTLKLFLTVVERKVCFSVWNKKLYLKFVSRKLKNGSYFLNHEPCFRNACFESRCKYYGPIDMKVKAANVGLTLTLTWRVNGQSSCLGFTSLSCTL